MPNDKMYKVGIGIDKKSQDKFRKDLENLIKPFEDAMKDIEEHGLNAGNRSKAKSELASIMKFTEKQVKAVQDMASGLIPSDEKQLNALKQNVQGLVTFMSEAMQRMSKVGASTDWMKNGVSFVDTFIHMKSTLQKTGDQIEGLQTQIGDLTKSFNFLKEAMVSVNPEAFGKRFGAEVRATTDSIKKAKSLIDSLKAQEHKGLQNELRIKKTDKDDIFTYGDEDGIDELKEAHAGIESEINKHLATIAKIEAQYANSKKSPYGSKEYRDSVHSLFVELQNFENLKNAKGFDEAFSNIGSEVTSSIKGVTAEINAATESAVKQIKDALSGIEGIEIGITIPDANSAEFTSKINDFIKKTSEEFKNNPVEITLDITDPFKNDSFDGNGAEKQIKGKQKKLSDTIAQTFKDNAQNIGVDIDEEDLNGLYSPNVNKITRNILDAFNKIHNIMSAGEKVITESSKGWRKQVEKELTIHPKFDVDKTKEDLVNAMTDLQNTLDDGDPLYINVLPDTRNFISTIQDALKEKEIKVDIKAGNIDGSEAVIDTNGAKIAHYKQEEKTTEDVQRDKSVQRSMITAPAVKENSNAVTESTHMQAVLKDAIGKLQSSIDANAEKDQRAEESIKRNTEIASKNANQIAEFNKQINKTRDIADAASDSRRSIKGKIILEEQKKEDALKAHADRLSSFRDAVKNNNEEYIQKEIDWAIQYLNQEKQKTLDHIERIRSRVDDDNKGKKVDFYNTVVSEIDELLKNVENQENFVMSAMRHYYHSEDSNINQNISDLSQAVGLKDREVVGANQNIDYYKREIEKLSKEIETAKLERGIRTRTSDSKKQQKRIDNINHILESNQNPVQLVFDEVANFWKQSYKIIEKTKGELEDLKNGKYSDDLKAELSKLSEEEQKLKIQGLIASKEKRVADWGTRQILMSQMGLGTNLVQSEEGKFVTEDVTIFATNLVKDKDGNFIQENIEGKSEVVTQFVRSSLEDALKSFSIESLTSLLSKSSTLSDDLLKKSNLNTLASIKDIAYYTGISQDALGFKTQTEKEYIDEKNLESRFIEILKINEYIKKARGLLSEKNIDVNPTAIQEFIDYFGHIPEMAKAVELARQYLDEVNKLPEDVLNSENPKTYAEKAQEIWSTIDKKDQNILLDAFNTSKASGEAAWTEVSDISTIFQDVLRAYNENDSSIKSLETDNPQLQQILAILQRSSLLNATKQATNQYGERGMLSTLFGTQKSKDSIHVSTQDRGGNEKIYELYGGKVSQPSDRRFTLTPNSLDRFINKSGAKEDIGQIINAMFDPLILAEENIQARVNKIKSELTKLQSKSVSYSAFDGTEFEDNWHQQKVLEGQINAIKTMGESDQIPDELWKRVKGFRDARDLEKEIEDITKGIYSDKIKAQLKDLSEKDKSAKVREIISGKQSELDSLKADNIKRTNDILAEKEAQFVSLREKNTGKINELVAAKQNELAEAEKQLEQARAFAAIPKNALQELIDNLFASGKIKLSYGKDAALPAWAQDEKFNRTKLSEYDKKEEQNKSTKERLEKEIAALESGDYSYMSEVIRRLEDSDEYKQSDDATKEQLKRDKLSKENIDKVINAKKEELARLQQAELTQDEIIQSLLILEDDIQRSDAKVKHLQQESRDQSKKSERVTDDSKSWAYNKEKNAKKNAMLEESRQFQINVGRTAHNREEPLANLLSRIEFAKANGLMDTSVLEDLVTKYTDLMEVAWNTTDLKHAGQASAQQANEAWDNARNARDELIKTYFETDGWYATQIAQDATTALDADIERRKQSIISDSSSSNQTVNAQFESVEAEKQRMLIAADEYEASLQEKYIRGPMRDVAIALEQNERAISDKAREVQNKKDNLYDIADGDSGLIAERNRLVALQEEELKPLHEARRNASGDEHNRIISEIKSVESKYSKQYAQAKQEWIDRESKKLDEEYQIFVDSISASTMDAANENAIRMFNEDMSDKGIHVNSIEELKLAIKGIIEEMYRAATEQAQKAREAIDASTVVSDKDIEKLISEDKDIQKKEQEKKDKLSAVRGKKDAELMAERHSVSSQAKAAQATLEAEHKKDLEQQKQDYMTRHHITQDMLDAARRQTQLNQELNEELSRSNDVAPSVEKEQTYSSGSGSFGLIDTSSLAQESTLRGIYELLNGGPPEGGWDKSIDENERAILNSGILGTAKINDFVRYTNFVQSLKQLMDDSTTLSNEVLTLVGDGKILTSTTNGRSSSVGGSVIEELVNNERHNIDFGLHNHPNSTYMPSAMDFLSAASMAYAKSMKEVHGSGSYNKDGISLIDFEGIPKQVTSDILTKTIGRWILDLGKEGIQYKNTGNGEQFVFDDDKYSGKTDEDLDSITNEWYNKLYESIRNNFAQAGYNDVFASFTYDEISKMAQPEVDSNAIQEASTQVSDAIVESATQTAVEVSKQKSKSKGKLTAEEKSKAQEIVMNSIPEAEKYAESYLNNNRENISTDNVDFIASQYLENDIGYQTLLEKQRKTKSENKKNEYLQYIDAIREQYKTIFDTKIREYLEKELTSVEDNLEIIEETSSNENAITAENTQPIQQATTQIESEIIEAGAQAAVESAKSITSEDIKAQQSTFQEKFKTKELKNGRKGFDIQGANKIDQAFYKIGDRLTKDTLTDGDLGKLSTAYSQLENAFKEEIINHLDQETIDFLNTLRGQISSVLDANKSIFDAKDQKSKSITDAKEYLSNLKENGQKVTGASRAETGIDWIYKSISDGTENLTDTDLAKVAHGYYKLQQTVNHAIFEKLDENTKKVINDAIEEAKTVLDKYNVTIQSDELIGTLLDDDNAKTFINANSKDKKKKSGRTISSVSDPQISKDGKVISNAKVYLDGTSKKQAEERAAAEQQINEEKNKQNQLSTEAAQKENATTSAVEERAQAEKEVAESKKKGETKDEPKSTYDSGTTHQSSGNQQQESGNTQGGILGILSRIATEDTLSAILSAITSGIKTSAGEKSGGESTDKTVLKKSEAEAKLKQYLNDNYAGAGYVPGAISDTPTGYSINATRQKVNTEAIKEAEAAIAKCTVGTKDWWDATKRLSLLQSEQENIIVRINAETGKITASTSFKNLAVGAKAAIKELQNIDDIMYRLHTSGALSVDDVGNTVASNDFAKKFLNAVDDLNEFTNGKTQDELYDPANNAILSNLTLAVQTYRKEIVSLLNAVDQYNVGESKGILSGVFGNESDIKQAMQSAITANSDLVTSFGNLTPVMKNGQVVSYQLAYTLKTGKREVQEMTASLNPLTHELTVQGGAVKEALTGWDRFFGGLKSKFASIIQYIASITSISDMIRYVRQGVQYVVEIDSALTELKKVTDETDASYTKFLQNMSKTGSVIGATVSDLTTMAAEWARLGYSMEDAGKLAESTAILLNVSEFEDATTASEALISTMQAFGYVADDSQHVVDILNEVGNNYAISSDGIATALQDSASALMEGGNNLEQAVALVASANKVVQDPNSVGSALRTISLRLRGTSVKVLEEMGEETEGVVESVSKMQSKIQALTGVNILTDSGAYKDTYTILREIGQVWEDMSDIDQAKCCLYVQKCA